MTSSQSGAEQDPRDNVIRELRRQNRDLKRKVKNQRVELARMKAAVEMRGGK